MIPEKGKAIALYEKYFLNRLDVVPAYVMSRISVYHVNNIHALLSAHLTGEKIRILEKGKVFFPIETSVRVGAYTPNLQNRTKFGCIDFDGGEHHANPLQDPEKAVIKTYLAFSQQGIKSYIERSNSGKGYHLWIFYEEPIEASLSIELCKCILDDNAIEVFPKSPKLKRGGKGSLVWLPWCHTAQDGGGVFYKYGDSLTPFLPTDFETNSKEKVLEIVGRFGDKRKSYTIKAGNDETEVWKIWRKNVLDNINLENIYGEFLTGARNGEWLSCRDPWSKTGDRSPSAGVSEGGEYERGTFHSFISGESLSLFDYIRKQGIVENTHIAACRYLSEVSGIDLPKTDSADLPPPTLITQEIDENDLPQIILSNRQFRDILDDAWSAIHHYNSNIPKVFTKSGLLVRVNGEELQLLNDIEMYGILGRCANWVKLTQTGILNALPMDKVAKDMVVCDHPRRCDLPQIDSIISTPVFAVNRELITVPGYHSAGKVWYSPSQKLCLPEIPKVPSSQDITSAKKLIFEDLFLDFPFLTKSDIAHTYAALFLPFVRQLIAGPTPLHVVEAPGPGTGKSKLCNLISIILSESACEARSLPGTDDEMRKMITAELLKAKPIILLDNASEKKKLDSPALAAILTSIKWTDRLLGESRMLNMNNFALWFLTANNPQLSMEIARRSIRIRLDAKQDQPWRRSNFKHEFIEEWAIENRNLLLRSTLILIQNWIYRGCPPGSRRLGSFEKWSSVIGGILEVNGIEGFLSNLEELYENSDTEGTAWRAFVGIWWASFKDELKTPVELLNLCESNGLLYSILGEGSPKQKLVKMADSLKINRERVITDYKVEAIQDKYRLVNMTASNSIEEAILSDITEDLFKL